MGTHRKAKRIYFAQRGDVYSFGLTKSECRADWWGDDECPTPQVFVPKAAR